MRLLAQFNVAPPSGQVSRQLHYHNRKTPPLGVPAETACRAAELTLRSSHASAAARSGNGKRRQGNNHHRPWDMGCSEGGRHIIYTAKTKVFRLELLLLSFRGNILRPSILCISTNMDEALQLLRQVRLMKNPFAPESGLISYLWKVKENTLKDTPTLSVFSAHHCLQVKLFQQRYAPPWCGW
jgi:hypothetical protein